MNTKKIFSIICILLLSFALAFTLIACGEEPAPEQPKEEVCTAHTDTNGDGKCDKCGAAVTPEAPECTEHKDENGDGKCDTCGADVTPEAPECTEHKDENGDNKCDTCGADLTPEKPECTEHKDENGDGKCDECDAEVTPEAPSETEITLVDNGVAKFNFVVASGVSSDVSKEVAMLVSDLQKLGIRTEILGDSAADMSACEVLVGPVSSRGDQYKIDEHSFGYEGYCIKLIGGRVLILAGSDETLLDAIKDFKKEILGINKKTEELTDVVMTPEMNIEFIQDDYTVKSVTIGDKDLRDYSIAINKKETVERNVALKVQENIYKKVGFWLPIVDRTEVEGNYIDILLTTAKTCASEKGFIAKVENGNLLFDCGFANKIEESVTGLIMSQITNQKVESVSIKEGYTYEKEDYKNIYYKDFGAKGDGKEDDFFAIKACHDEANKYGHTVHAERNSTYYLGKGSGDNTISVKTDTYWHGCSFIFDDSQIKAPPYDSTTGKATGEKGDPEYYTPIFTVDSDGESLYYTESNYLPITSLKEGATNIGFAPGYRAMVIPYNDNVRHFIRFGANQNSGNPQQEIIMVEADGTIDPTTPVQWTYDTITRIEVLQREDEAIVIDGMADNGERQTHIETVFNGAPSFYSYYKRNIYIRRPNTTIRGIRHTIIEENETGAPYSGFISIEYTENVIVDACEFQCPKTYYTIGSAGTRVNMGTYEIHSNYSNNVLWQNCTQSNFFEPDGSIKFNGMMGTNRCKNLFFDNMFVCSFDAHCGTYNATIKNTTAEHLNFIGEGTITIENVTVYTDASHCAFNFRSDYGATWQGDLYIDGLNLKYSTNDFVELGKTQWNNHFFGYTTYLPEKIVMKNVTTNKISFKMDGDGNRQESSVSINEKPLHLFSFLEQYTEENIADPYQKLERYPTQDAISCICEEGFFDPDGDGLCNTANCGLPKEADRTLNRNPFVPTKELYIEDCPGLKVILPNTPQFKDMKVYVDGEEFYWKVLGEVSVPK